MKTAIHRGLCLPANYLLLFLILFSWSSLNSQILENFETETTGATTFSEGGISFNTLTPLAVQFFENGGGNGSMDDLFLEGIGTGAVGAVEITTPGKVFQIVSMDVYLTNDLVDFNTVDANVTFRGTTQGGSTIDAIVAISHPSPGNFLWAQSVNLAATALGGQNLTKIEFILGAGVQYLGIDDFTFNQLDETAISVSINDVSLTEGNAGNTSFQFTLARNLNTSDFNVTVATANGTASAGSDYTAIAPTVINFPLNGALTHAVTVNVNGDVFPEADEDFFVNLSSATSGTQILDSQGQGTIEDDDTVCETFEDELAAGLSSFSEVGIDFTVTDQLITGFFSNGGSTNSDYFLESDAANFPHTGSVGEIQITSPNKVFEVLQLDLFLSNSSNDSDPNTTGVGDVDFIGKLVTGGTVIVTKSSLTIGGSWMTDVSFAGTALDGALLTALEIEMQAGGDYVAIDNFKFAAYDNNTTLVFIDNVVMTEGDAGTKNFTFTISRNNNTSDFGVSLATADGSATGGSDYNIISTSLNFTNGGSLSQMISVVVNGDTDSEINETFFVNLSNPTNGAVISSGIGTGTILDDDTICETFEDENAADLTVFSEGGLSFISTGVLATDFLASGGSTGSDFYLDSDINNVPHGGSVGQIQVSTPNHAFQITRLDLWISNDSDPNTQDPGSIRIIGSLEGGGTVMTDISTTQSDNSWIENVDFTGTPLANQDLLAMEFELLGDVNYLAIDNFCFEVVELCGLLVECVDSSLGSFDCSQIVSIPDNPSTVADLESAPYNMQIGDLPCGNIIVNSSDDVQNINFCALGGQTVTRTIEIFDDLNSNNALDLGEESHICTFTFEIIEDELAPVPPTPPMDLNLACAADLPPPVDLTATDNCGGAITSSPTASILPGNCVNDFTMIRTWTFTDICGNTSSVNQTIIVLDELAPVPPTPPLDLNLACAADVPPPVDLTATDNCGGAITSSPTASILPGNCVNDFTMIRTWTFTDICGNTSSVNQTIIVLDELAPVPPTPPMDLNLACAADVPPPVDLTAIDNCGGAITSSPTASIFPGNCVNDFTMIRTWTFTDICGNTSSVSQTIIVLDELAPVPPTPPMDLNLACAADVPPPVDLTATDNCGGAITSSPTASIFPGNCVNDFTMIRTWTFTDICGNSSSVNQTIVVLDELAPVPPSPPMDLNLACAADVPPPVDLTATDNCGVDITSSPTASILPGNCINDFTMIRTWTFTDICGNTSSVNQTIVVADVDAPILNDCPAGITVNCNESVPAAAILTASDNCDNVGVDFSEIRSNDCTNDNYSLIRTWTSSDVCGNEAECEQIITINSKLSDPCYTLAGDVTYNPGNNTTTFTWEVCILDPNCKDLSNIRFSLPCSSPKSSVSNIWTSVPNVQFEVSGNPQKCKKYDVKFEDFEDDALLDEPNSCGTFSYTVEGDFSGYLTNVKPKAGNEPNLGFFGIGSICTCEDSILPAVAISNPNLGNNKPLELLSMDYSEGASLKAFPNPAGKVVNVELNGFDKEVVQIELLDFMGKTIKKLNHENGQSLIRIQLEEGYQDGLYYIKVNNSKQSAIVPLIILNK